MRDDKWSTRIGHFAAISFGSALIWVLGYAGIAMLADWLKITPSSLGIPQEYISTIGVAVYCLIAIASASIVLESVEANEREQRQAISSEEQKKYAAKERKLVALLEMERDGLRSEVQQEKWKLASEERELKKKVREALRTADIRQKEAKWYAQSIKKAFAERASGFSSLHESISELDALVDEGLAVYLENKKRPALSAAETVREQTKLRRKAEVEAKTARSIIEYYERSFPDLAEIRQNELEDDSEDEVVDVAYTEQERQDPATQLLARSEYLKLTPSERNQLALDRYWKRRHSNKHVGKMYERYIGYIYECQGYAVSYYGIDKELDDLGRDLVCVKDKKAVIVQCKNWSKHKTVRENRVFQHFGTVFEYKQRHPDMNVTAAFYTTTAISDVAKEFAKTLGMEIFDNYKFDKSYPCIKCNIGRDGSKIYHLPFDQQYDKVNIEPAKGEFFAKTVKEAENAGFRRAYRWQGNKS